MSKKEDIAYSFLQRALKYAGIIFSYTRDKNPKLSDWQIKRLVKHRLRKEGYPSRKKYELLEKHGYFDR